MTINTENRINETIAPDDMIPGYVQDNPEVVVAQQPEHARIAKAVFDKMQQSPQLGQNGVNLARKKIKQSGWSAVIFRNIGTLRISGILGYIPKPATFIPSKLYRKLDLPLFRRRQKPSFLPKKSAKYSTDIQPDNSTPRLESFPTEIFANFQDDYMKEEPPNVVNEFYPAVTNNLFSPVSIKNNRGHNINQLSVMKTLAISSPVSVQQGKDDKLNADDYSAASSEKSGKSTVINGLRTSHYQQTMGKQLSPKNVTSFEKDTFSEQETKGNYKPMHSDLESISLPTEDQLMQDRTDLPTKKATMSDVSVESAYVQDKSLSSVAERKQSDFNSTPYQLKDKVDTYVSPAQIDAFSRTIYEKDTQVNNKIKVGHSEKLSTPDKIDKYTEKPLKITPLQKTVESDKKTENPSKSRIVPPMVKPSKTDVNTPFDIMYKKDTDITRDAITGTSRESATAGILGVDTERSRRSLSLNRNKSFSDKAVSRIGNQSLIVSPTILKTKTLKDSALPIVAQQVKLSEDNQTVQSGSYKLKPFENNLKTDVDIYDYVTIQKSEESHISPDATDSLDVTVIDKPIVRKTRTRTTSDLFDSNKLISNKTNISKAVDQTASTSVSLSADIRQIHKKRDQAVESYKTGLTENSPHTHEVYKMPEDSAIASNHEKASDVYTNQACIKEEIPSTKLDEPLYFTKPVILNSPDLRIFRGIGNIPDQVTSISRRILKTTGQKSSSIIDESGIGSRDIQNLYMTSRYCSTAQNPLDFPVVSQVNREFDHESSHSEEIQRSLSVKPYESIRNDSYGMPDLALIPVTRKKEPALEENTMVNRQEITRRNDRENTQNIRAIADKVYALLRQELKIEREREKHRLLR